MSKQLESVTKTRSRVRRWGRLGGVAGLVLSAAACGGGTKEAVGTTGQAVETEGAEVMTNDDLSTMLQGLGVPSCTVQQSGNDLVFTPMGLLAVEVAPAQFLLPTVNADVDLTINDISSDFTLAINFTNLTVDMTALTVTIGSSYVDVNAPVAVSFHVEGVPVVGNFDVSASGTLDAHVQTTPTSPASDRLVIPDGGLTLTVPSSGISASCGFLGWCNGLIEDLANDVLTSKTSTLEQFLSTAANQELAGSASIVDKLLDFHMIAFPPTPNQAGNAWSVVPGSLGFLNQAATWQAIHEADPTPPTCTIAAGCLSGTGNYVVNAVCPAVSQDPFDSDAVQLQRFEGDDWVDVGDPVGPGEPGTQLSDVDPPVGIPMAYRVESFNAAGSAYSPASVLEVVEGSCVGIGGGGGGTGMGPRSPVGTCGNGGPCRTQ
jgi:hypothetical protein